MLICISIYYILSILDQCNFGIKFKINNPSAELLKIRNRTCWLRKSFQHSKQKIFGTNIYNYIFHFKRCVSECARIPESEFFAPKTYVTFKHNSFMFFYLPAHDIYSIFITFAFTLLCYYVIHASHISQIHKYTTHTRAYFAVFFFVSLIHVDISRIMIMRVQVYIIIVRIRTEYAKLVFTILINKYMYKEIQTHRHTFSNTQKDRNNFN